MAVHPLLPVELEFGDMVFVNGKLENPKKNPQSKDENQQQTQPTFENRSANRAQATVMGGKRSRHCTIPAPHKFEQIYIITRPAWLSGILSSYSKLKFVHLMSLSGSLAPGGWGVGGYLGQVLLGMCRWHLRTPTPL